RETRKKKRLSPPTGGAMAITKGASPIPWNEKGCQSHRGRRGEKLYLGLIAFHCIWAMVYDGDICAISGLCGWAYFGRAARVYISYMGRQHENGVWANARCMNKISSMY